MLYMGYLIVVAGQNYRKYGYWTFRFLSYLNCISRLCHHKSCKQQFRGFFFGGGGAWPWQHWMWAPIGAGVLVLTPNDDRNHATANKRLPKHSRFQNSQWPPNSLQTAVQGNSFFFRGGGVMVSWRRAATSKGFVSPRPSPPQALNRLELLFVVAHWDAYGRGRSCCCIRFTSAQL